MFDRYVVHGSLNAEGNSAMGRNERMGYFPAVGLAWNFQNEPFMKTARDKWLDEAKFRFSIGQSGRAPSGASVYLGAYVKGTDYMNMSATKQARMQLDNLKWETSTEYNYGLDASVLKGRLRFTFDYYYKTVEDLLQRTTNYLQRLVSDRLVISIRVKWRTKVGSSVQMLFYLRTKTGASTVM